MEVFDEPGRITDTLVMLDAIGWGFPKTTCSFVVMGKKIAFIEPAQKSSVGKLTNSLESQNIDLSKIRYILATHRHFDHVSGAASLLANLKNALVCAHSITLNTLKNPEKMNFAVNSTFGEISETIEEIKNDDKLRILNEGDRLDLGDGLEIEAIHTPGHTSDHLMFYERKNKFLYAGDALGIFGFKSLSVLPSSLPPSFNYDKYKKSLEKLLNHDIELIAFSHFGGVKGKDAKAVIETAIQTLENWKNIAYETRELGHGINELLRRLETKYKPQINVFSDKTRDSVFQMLVVGFSNAFFA